MKSSKIGKRDGGLINMTTQTEQIRGKVARILNSREVALNVGQKHGVQQGMIFEILSESGGEIRDPDSGDILGVADVAKARVKIKRAYEKFAVATTYRTRRVNVGGVGPSAIDISRYFAPPKWETRYETLKTEGGFEAASEDLTESESYVRVGDSVVQVVDDE